MKPKYSIRERRKLRAKKKLSTRKPGRYLLKIFRSSKHTYAQVMDPESGAVVATASTLEDDVLKAKDTVSKEGLHGTASSAKSVVAAKAVGIAVAERSLKKGIDRVVFDRNGFLYHGRVKALADGARGAGLKF